jgi:SAM-dependent methyltransferase
MIREKIFLRRIYEEWYASIVPALPIGNESVLEIGSGAGFLNEIIPDVITSEVFWCSDVNVIMDGCEIPFANDTLKGIVMTDVLHHLPKPRLFFSEAARCVRSGGVLVMIEPWITPWSKLVYKRLHHETFRLETQEWEFPETGPLSGANSALPWIIFQRDRRQFELEFPQWRISGIKLSMPFRYLLSGGVSMRSLMPGWAFGFWGSLEKSLEPLMKALGMFALIILKRTQPMVEG